MDIKSPFYYCIILQTPKRDKMILAVDIIQEYREKIRNKIQKEKLDEKL
ncbi:hypothetical protein AAID96_03930 [Campylobacter coli]